MAQPANAAQLPDAVRSAVLVKSVTVDTSTAPKVSGYDFNRGLVQRLRCVEPPELSFRIYKNS